MLNHLLHCLTYLSFGHEESLYLLALIFSFCNLPFQEFCLSFVLWEPGFTFQIQAFLFLNSSKLSVDRSLFLVYDLPQQACDNL